jgi:hypothetical protein
VDAGCPATDHPSASHVLAHLSMNTVLSPGIPDEPLRLRAGAAVSWGAILGGAVIAVALTSVFFVVGEGIGYARGGSAAATAAVAIWLIVTQWISAAAGGFVTGRLRHRWLATHTHEVFFRDTAHGLCMWATATVAMALFAVGGLASHRSEMPGMAEGPRSADGAHMPNLAGRPPGMDGGLDYEVGKLFRSASESSQLPLFADAWHEAEALAAHATVTGSFSDDDRAYLQQLTARSGVSAEQARRRVETFEAVVRERHEQAQAEIKKLAKAALFTGLSMLIGAFIAAVAAAIGGRMRDEHT